MLFVMVTNDFDFLSFQGMLVYREHTSDVAKNASCGSGVFSMKFIKCVVSLMQDFFLRDWL